MASKAAVNVPVNQQIKERDVNNKLQLYGIYSAFANGKVPSNAQIDVALNSVLESDALSNPSKKLSAEGQQLVADLRDVIEKAKVLVLSKNDGNLLQDFIWQTQQISKGNFKSPNMPVEKETAQQHSQEALEGLRTLGTLILSNGQFRKLLNDATILLRSIAGDAATKAAGKVNPNEDQLAQLDEPAADDTWHDVPDLSKDALRGQAKEAYNKNKPFARSDVQKAAGDASEAAHPRGSRDPADAADLAAQDQQAGTASGVDAASGAQAGVETLKGTAKENIPEDTQQKGKEYKGRTQDYLKGKMPKERREQTIWRLKKMVVEIQGHEDYLQAVETLLRLAEEYSGHSKHVALQGHSSVQDARGDDSLQIAENDLRTLIERFANSTSLDDLFDSIDTIYKDADKDEQLRNWFKKMDTFVRKCLKEQGFIMKDECNDEWNQLYDEGNFLLRDKYRTHTDRIVDEFKFLGNQFDEDPQNKALGEAVKKLTLDLGQDENGNPKFKPHLLKDVSEVIIPAFFENIRYVPIPRIEYSDPMMDAVVENLVIEGDNLAPNVFEFSTDNYFRWGRKKIQNKNKNKVMVAVSGVQADLRDVSYYLKKKQGFPSITDQGIMDIHFGGEGLAFKIEMENADPKDQANFFKINKVDVQVKNFTINVKQSKHKLLLLLAKPLMLRAIRPALQKVAEKQIKQNAAQLDQFLYGINQEAKKAQEDFQNNPDPENAQNIYQRYASAFNQQLMQGKEKVNRVAKDKKVNMAVTAHDSIFPNIKLPGGISSKATEYKELAAKGDKWESPIFSIGTAKESSNVPKPDKISTKPHSTATSGQGFTNGNVTNGNAATGLGNQMDRAFDGTNGQAMTNGRNVANGNRSVGV
ncbi:hypothetical protein NA57DRAFT_51856 [Rhizodiscina lignyota]|uniref:Uncharacterized protein n=1 Tax=Rhizodiscina lignyota TaxID=1504668 RepID=A0A9P4IVB1_9PEZI|nr:hypothetical protein NA57DRAFT_51856 [Rhizodiscina lignyota]